MAFWRASTSLLSRAATTTAAAAAAEAKPSGTSHTSDRRTAVFLAVGGQSVELGPPVVALEAHVELEQVVVRDPRA